MILPPAPAETPAPPPGRRGETGVDGLTEADRKRVAALSDRDREVRAHETAHVQAGRPWTGTPVYAFERGPDGRRYAVSGAVAIDVAPVKGDPEATADKMRVVERAALAPEEPSLADRRVAAQARAELVRALAELAAAARAPRTPSVLLRL